MTSVDPLQSLLTETLYSQLDRDITPPGKLSQKIKHFITEAIRPRGNNQSYYFRVTKGFLIRLPEDFDRCIGIAVCLEISKITHGRIFGGKECDPPDNLGRDILLDAAIIRIKTLVVAISASPFAFGAIPVGTGKSGIQGYFLNAPLKPLPEPGRIIVVSLVTPPWEFSWLHRILFVGKNSRTIRY
jgi:hypothetical protein